MGAIDNFLKRRGYAKLDRYGLVLTPDERVLSSRPAILDDGLGGKIVGWVDGDLAAMELEKWSPAPMPAAAKTVAVTGRLQPPERPKSPTQRSLPGVAPAQTAPVAVVPAPVASAPAAAPAPMAAPAAPVLVAPAPMIAAAPAPVAARSPLPAAMAAPTPAPAPMAEEDDEAEWERIRAKMASVPASLVPRAPVVAAEPELTEDEWEWEIAMARSRAAAEEVVQSAAAMQFSKPKGPAPKAPGKTMQMAAVASPSATKAPAPYAAKKPYAPMAQAPKTMPMAAVAAPKKPEPMPEWPKTEPLNESWEQERTEATAPVAEAAPVKRSTVIPVPQLPVAARPSDVRPPPSSRTISPRTRVARGTGREDTVQIHAAPSNDDTSPYVTIPSEVRGSQGYAHTKRAAAKHR